MVTATLTSKGQTTVLTGRLYPASESAAQGVSNGFVGFIVLVETCWVLKCLYGATAAELNETGRDLLDARQLAVESRALVARAVGRATDDGADIVDALIAECAASAGCKRTVTFDKSAAKAGMSVLR